MTSNSTDSKAPRIKTDEVSRQVVAKARSLLLEGVAEAHASVLRWIISTAEERDTLKAVAKSFSDMVTDLKWERDRLKAKIERDRLVQAEVLNLAEKIESNFRKIESALGLPRLSTFETMLATIARLQETSTPASAPMTSEEEKTVRAALAEAYRVVRERPPDPSFGPCTLTCAHNHDYVRAITDAGPALLASLDEARSKIPAPCDHAKGDVWKFGSDERAVVSVVPPEANEVRLNFGSGQVPLSYLNSIGAVRVLRGKSGCGR